MIPFLFIAAGLYIYWRSFGWHLVYELHPVLFVVAFFIVIGLVLFLRTRASKYHS